MVKKILLAFVLIAMVSRCANKEQGLGETEITKWQYGKNGAVSLTYDDGSINQFRKALPIMERLNLPATFFIITGALPGSRYTGKFIGRPVIEIIRETADIPTNEENFFERASAVRYLGYQGTLEYFDRAASLYAQGKETEAYQVLDEVYKKARNGKLKPGHDISMEESQEKGLSWDDINKYASRGYEFGSHTVTHAHLAILDTANILYELEKSKADILEHMGPEYTFSAEIPYGIEDERVMEYAFQVYPALRNRMPEPFLDEINRSNNTQPGMSDNEYVQWQRGPLSSTPLNLMKSWVDTTMAHDNIWLVLVFHGIDDIGWEALPHELLEEYFKYIQQREDKLWVATFGDVTKYMRERMNAMVQADVKDDKIVVTLQHSLDTSRYNIPLTLKTYVPKDWKKVLVKQGNSVQQVHTESDKQGTYVLYQAYPNRKALELSTIL